MLKKIGSVFIALALLNGTGTALAAANSGADMKSYIPKAWQTYKKNTHASENSHMSAPRNHANQLCEFPDQESCYLSRCNFQIGYQCQQCIDDSYACIYYPKNGNKL